MQKPGVFVDATASYRKTDHIRFVMAGSGDMMDQMIRLVADRGIAHKFHFTGFLREAGLRDAEIKRRVRDAFGLEPLAYRHLRQCSATCPALSPISRAVQRFYTT